jgi:hypothetical protein
MFNYAAEERRLFAEMEHAARCAMEAEQVALRASFELQTTHAMTDVRALRASALPEDKPRRPRRGTLARASHGSAHRASRSDSDDSDETFRATSASASATLAPISVNLPIPTPRSCPPLPPQPLPSPPRPPSLHHRPGAGCALGNRGARQAQSVARGHELCPPKASAPQRLRTTVREWHRCGAAGAGGSVESARRRSGDERVKESGPAVPVGVPEATRLRVRRRPPNAAVSAVNAQGPSSPCTATQQDDRTDRRSPRTTTDDSVALRAGDCSDAVAPQTGAAPPTQAGDTAAPRCLKAPASYGTGPIKPTDVQTSQTTPPAHGALMALSDLMPMLNDLTELTLTLKAAADARTQGPSPEAFAFSLWYEGVIHIRSLRQRIQEYAKRRQRREAFNAWARNASAISHAGCREHHAVAEKSSAAAMRRGFRKWRAWTVVEHRTQTISRELFAVRSEAAMSLQAARRGALVRGALGRRGNA